MALTKVTDGVLNSLLLTNLIAQSSLNAKDYGATGDGTTNDAASLQSAINAAVADGKNLYIPEGEYNCGSTTLTIGGSIRVFGAGAGQTILKKTVDTADELIFATGQSSIEIEGIRFDYTPATTTASDQLCAIRLLYTTKSAVRNCHVTGLFYVGINFEHSEQCQATGCYIRGVKNRALYAYQTCKDIIFSHNHIDGFNFGGTTPTTDYGININPAGSGQYIYGVVVSNNTVRNSVYQGISTAENTVGATITGNVVFNITGFYGILIQKANSVSNFYTTVTGNFVQGCGTYGIYCTESWYTVIQGNEVVNSTSHGIACNIQQNSVISGNISIANGGAGINLVGSSRNVITSNQCVNNVGYGLTISSSSSFYTRYNDNYFYNNTGGTVSDSGTGSSAGTNLTS
jgi:parallel beta-helix repeat protein